LNSLYMRTVKYGTIHFKQDYWNFGFEKNSLQFTIKNAGLKKTEMAASWNLASCYCTDYFYNKTKSVMLRVNTELHKTEPFLFDTAPRSTLREAFLKATLNDVPKISGSLKMYNKLLSNLCIS
jgi:hypothetical protein